MVRLSPSVFRHFERFSLYNSPYPAHDAGHAIDLYPSRDTAEAPSPVAGEVLDVHRTEAPERPGGEGDDYLIVVDSGAQTGRLLHVEPSVEVGDHVERGDSLGRLIDSGYFAPWVDPHVHLGFRPPGANVVRARGSLPLCLPFDVRAVPWDGRGTVVRTEATHLVLDAPGHPDPGRMFAGVSADGGRGALDGGLPHYPGGGLLSGQSGPVSLFGVPVGEANGRDVCWRDVSVQVDGRPARGLSLFCGRDALYVKVVCPAVADEFESGEAVTVTIARGPSKG
ncbi:MAG: hypothetical protein ABEJ35_06135 [Halobacteriaceae archaeon]